MLSKADDDSFPFLKQRVDYFSLADFSFSSFFVILRAGVSVFFLLLAEDADAGGAFRFWAEGGCVPSALLFGRGAGGSLGRKSSPPNWSSVRSEICKAKRC